jgi:hypothetical protein
LISSAADIAKIGRLLLSNHDFGAVAPTACTATYP